jgi:hypothetical protein
MANYRMYFCSRCGKCFARNKPFSSSHERKGSTSREACTGRIVVIMARDLEDK